MRRLRPDLVHLHGQFAGFYGALAARLSGTPAIYTAHFPSFITDSNRRNRVRNHLAEWLPSKVSTKVITCSETSRHEYISRGLVEPERIVTIYNGVLSEQPTCSPAALRAELGLAQDLVETVDALGYEEPTPIQREAVPPLIAGRDLVGQAATGTGKTAAFALPVLQRLLDRSERAGVLALVLVPTRELAIQVSEAMHTYGRDIKVRVLPVYGGQPISRQLRALERGVDVVVATPGRALDHIARGTLDLSGLEIVVLDEADEMFDMGFAEDIETILGKTPRTGRPRCSRRPCRRGSTAWCAGT